MVLSSETFYAILIILGVTCPDVVLIFQSTHLCPAWRIDPETLPSGNNRIPHYPGSNDPKEKGAKTTAIRTHEKTADNSFSCELSLVRMLPSSTLEVPQAHHTPQGKKLTGHWCWEVDQGQGQRGLV